MLCSLELSQQHRRKNMACILVRGFEHGSIYDLDSSSGLAYLSVSATAKRPGGYSNYGLFCNDSSAGQTHQILLPTAKSEFYLQAVMNFTSLGNGHLIKWKNGSTVLGSLYLDATNHVWKLYTGNAASLVATGTIYCTSGVWYIIELYIKINDAGTLTLRINGVQDCTFSGDTKPGAETEVTTIEFTSATGLRWYLDDIIINDTTGNAPGNSWPSGAYVVGILPTGAGATTQWTPSTGSNYACVDETPPAAADFVSVNAVDQIDSYVMADLPAGPAVVLGLETALFAIKIPGATPTTLKPLVRHSGTDYPEASGLTVPLSSAIPVRKCYAQNPGTSADWSVADVNGVEIGFKSAA
jgi:hypothetical protein